jgi:hypothetical protein
MSTTREVHCTLDVAQTPETLHAHVELFGIDIDPGDTVLVHGAPIALAYGDSLICERTATVVKAGALSRLWTRLTARFELEVLYEVGFLPRSRP